MRKCCYPLCSHGAKDTCKMHKLPGEAEKCRMWMRQCRVAGTPRKLPAAVYICSCHFEGRRGPTKDHPNPIAFTTPSHTKSVPAKVFRPNVEDHPHEDEEMDVDDPQSTASKLHIGEPHDFPNLDKLLKSLEKVVVPDVIDVLEVVPEETEVEECVSTPDTKPRFQDLGQLMVMAMTGNQSSFSSEHSSRSEKSELAQALNSFEYEKPDEGDFKMEKRMKVNTASTTSQGTSASSKEKETRDFGVQCEMALFSYDKMIHWSDADFKYFTGVSKESFEILYQFLGGDKVTSSLKYKMDDKTPTKELYASHCPRGRLLMTLVRLRRGYPLIDMSKFFNLSPNAISYIFTAWIKLMALKFKSLENALFVSAAAQDKNKPPCFKPFPNLRCIVDCTEIKIQKPHNFEQQSCTFSQYKKTNTVKFLIACSVYGGLSFISEGVEGNMSDRKLFIKSGVLDHLNPGEAVMVDRGFDIECDLNKHDIDIIIPPFRGDRVAFTEREMYEGKAVATTRIYVETLIGRIKEYRLIRYVMPNSLLDIVSDIVRVCAVLCNFNEPFIRWATEEPDPEKK